MANNNLPSLWRFDFGDYSQLGPVFQKFLANLNLFTQGIYNIVNGGIGYSNMKRSVYSTTLTAGSTTTLSFVNPLNIAPSGVSVIKVQLDTANTTAITNAVSAANWYYDGRTIHVLALTGLTSGKSYNISLEVS